MGSAFAILDKTAMKMLQIAPAMNTPHRLMSEKATSAQTKIEKMASSRSQPSTRCGRFAERWNITSLGRSISSPACDQSFRDN